MPWVNQFGEYILLPNSKKIFDFKEKSNNQCVRLKFNQANDERTRETNKYTAPTHSHNEITSALLGPQNSTAQVHIMPFLSGGRPRIL